ncbi:MAG: histidine--tRNA ligase [Firmicutes bacterium]|nr:histidine--tRNA ligase [Bacillota bacterium]
MSNNAITPKITPRTLQGFMELLPQEQILFNRVQDTIRHSYEAFGFLPLDTPILEYADILLAKAGGETEKQIYRFNKGDTDLCMRFDLTVPLAKFVAKNANELVFPFRRYQIGKVYRGERPQKGRFREFYQCDVDIVGDGKLSLASDAEMASVIATTFSKLGFSDFTICVSNRKILTGYLEFLKLSDRRSEISIVIDKLKKIGREKVEEELSKLGLAKKAVSDILKLIAIEGSAEEQLVKLSKIKGGEMMQEGANELAEVIRLAKLSGVSSKHLVPDLTIVRGLDYYTGTVFETFLTGHENIGSVCSGGRYDDLAGYYTDKKLPGVGVSIGLTRLFDKLRDEFLEVGVSIADVLVVSMDDNLDACLTVANKFRESGLKVEVYTESAKPKNKFKYANRQGVKFVAVIGESERAAGTVTLKNMASGEQSEGIEIEKAIENVLK